ncbi:MAG: hypothetical protein R3A46_14085 [Thermomicrobiales bacterium]
MPPHTITSRVFGRRRPSAFTVGGSDASQTNPLTVVLHFAYGGACGSILALSERFVRFPRVLTGVVAGLVVWAGSYLAWLPALGILSPATEHPPRRTALIDRSPYRMGGERRYHPRCGRQFPQTSSILPLNAFQSRSQVQNSL